jgi:hypothetical protein
VIRRLLLPTLALLLLCAAPLRAQTVESFVDLDDDGVRDANEPALLPLLWQNGGLFNAYAAQPGYTPQRGPVGVVLQGRVVLGAGQTMQLILSGHARISGQIMVSKPDVSVFVTTVGSDVEIAPGTIISGRSDVVFQASNGGNITIGDGGRFSTSGDFSLLTFDAAGLVQVGSNVSFQLKGGYDDVGLHGRTGLTIGTGLAFRGPNHAGFTALSTADITLDDASIRGGYIHLESYSDDAHPGAKHVWVKNSTLWQTYLNGDFRILAAADQRAGRYAPDAIVLENTTVRTRILDPLYIPAPVVR